MTEATVRLVCPDDHAPLNVDASGGLCPSCGTHYPLDQGVYSFARQDDFYEGHYRNQIRYLPKRKGLLHELPLWWVSNGYVWRIRQYVPEGSTVVELGCAGGVAYLGSRYRMAGVDLSRSSLEAARCIYSLCVQANASRLPFASESSDAVVSSYFWEHVAPDQKPGLAREIWRVLKPGGRLVFLYDVASHNPLIMAMIASQPDLYRKEFIEQDGHLGYETAETNEAVFKAAGFQILRSLPMERSPLQSPSVYQKLANWPGLGGAVGHAAGFLARAPFNYPYGALLRLIDDAAGRLLPRSWGRIMLTVAERI